MEFQAFGKIPRLNREICVTEKIDGTNAQVCITLGEDPGAVANVDGYSIYAGSRTRWVTPGDDNFGWAKWVQDNAAELVKLGEGRHFGEWWGAGIQRKYGLPEKRFSLFNTSIWNAETMPSCCSVVPVLWNGLLEEFDVDKCLAKLRSEGSVAAPGFMDPEGVVIYHVAAGTYFKKTLDKDDEWKGKK
jgi:hypothetical protein